MEDLVIGSGLPFAAEEEGAQTTAEEEQQGQEDACGERDDAAKHDCHGQGQGSDAITVAQAEEIDEIVPADGRNGEGDSEEDEKGGHRGGRRSRG